MSENEAFKLTYATRFNPPEMLHHQFEAALLEVRQNPGKEYAMLVGGEERLYLHEQVRSRVKRV